MKLRHPSTGAVYSTRDDGSVEVEDRGGRRGVFQHDGTWVRGELHEADPHLLGFLAGPSITRRGPTGSVSAEQAGPQGVPVPDFNATSSNQIGTGSERDMDLGLNGRKALVTAATRGIGLAIAQTLADQGCDVAICARGAAGLETAQKDLEARGVKVFTQVVDVADGDALKEFVAAAAAALGGLDIFVSNASAGGGPGEGAWQPTFDIDVMGAVRGISAATPFLAESNAGSVVLISSTAALEYLGIPQAYNSMKAALPLYRRDRYCKAPVGVRQNRALLDNLLIIITNTVAINLA